MMTYLTAIGGGTFPTLTGEALRVLLQADKIYGWQRTLDGLPEGVTENRVAIKGARNIISLLEADAAQRNPALETVVVVYSGDTGFYSGARMLLPKLKDAGLPVEVIPGVSSVQILAARLGKSWQKWNMASAHGVACNPVTEVMKGQPTVFLTGGKTGPKELCTELSAAGLGHLKAVIAEDLTYDKETIRVGTVEDFVNTEVAVLNLLLVEPAEVLPERAGGYPDASFERGSVPMTKREVRAAVLGTLGVASTDTVWDIGAGTGSVSVELALQARQGRTFAVECDKDALKLIQKNKEKFHTYNLTVVEAVAPEGLSDLPTPDAVFVGGSRGNLPEILEAVLTANDKARICITAITLETLEKAIHALAAHNIEADVTQISVARSKALGTHHLLKAENPIFLISGNCDE